MSSAHCFFVVVIFSSPGFLAVSVSEQFTCSGQPVPLMLLKIVFNGGKEVCCFPAR